MNNINQRFSEIGVICYVITKWSYSAQVSKKFLYNCIRFKTLNIFASFAAAPRKDVYFANMV